MSTPDDSPNPKIQPPDDAWLEQALREDASDYFADDGFTARVLGALPPRRTITWRRPVLLGGATALGTVMAVTLGGADMFREADRAINWLYYWSVQPLLDTGLTLGVVGTLVLSALIVWTVWRRAIRD